MSKTNIDKVEEPSPVKVLAFGPVFEQKLNMIKGSIALILSNGGRTKENERRLLKMYISQAKELRKIVKSIEHITKKTNVLQTSMYKEENERLKKEIKELKGMLKNV